MRPQKGIPVSGLSAKYERLFTQAETIYRWTDIPCEQSIVTLSTSLGLSGGYLSDRRQSDKINPLVERAVLLRYGVGPVDELKAILAEPKGDLSSEILREQRVNEAWDRFHERWPHWRSGTPVEFTIQLANLDPPGGLLDAEPLKSARLEVAAKVSTRERAAAKQTPESLDLNSVGSTDVTLATDEYASKGRAETPPPLPAGLPVLTRAFHYALIISTTARASGAPAISHLQQVVGIVLENGGSEEEAAAAFLHDVAEDYGEDKLETIQSLFGANVASIVRECSDSFKVQGQHRRPWFPRKHDFLKALPRKTVSALRVMVADKLHNARSMLRDGRVEGDQLWAKLKRTPEETTAYFAVAQRIFAARLPSAPTTELGLVVALLESSFCNASLLGEKITAFSRDVSW